MAEVPDSCSSRPTSKRQRQGYRAHPFGGQRQVFRAGVHAHGATAQPLRHGRRGAGADEGVQDGGGDNVGVAGASGLPAGGVGRPFESMSESGRFIPLC